MRFISWLLEELFYVTGITWLDGIISTFIGLIAFSVAFLAIGFLAPLMRYDSKNMSEGHWIIRILVFAGLWWILQTFAKIITQSINWMNQNWWLYIVIGVVSVVLITYLIIKKKKSITRKQK
jgi:uncharacterized membrane protein HdeD (DUF308 family)